MSVPGRSVRILEHAARHGFRGMNLAHLKELMNILEMTFAGPPPTLEYEVCRALVEYILPGLSAPEVLALLEQRTFRLKPKYETYITADCLDGLTDVMDESEIELAKASMTKYRQAIQQEKSKFAAAAKAVAKAAGKVGAGRQQHQKKPRTLGSHDASTLESAQAFAPPCRGCVLYREAVWHLRWRITYPREYPPYSCSRGFAEGDVAGQRRALLECLRWAWAEHYRLTGQACPYDLSA